MSVHFIHFNYKFITHIDFNMKTNWIETVKMCFLGTLGWLRGSSVGVCEAVTCLL